MIKLIVAGGLFVIAVMCAPGRSSAAVTEAQWAKVVELSKTDAAQQAYHQRKRAREEWGKAHEARQKDEARLRREEKKFEEQRLHIGVRQLPELSKKLADLGFTSEALKGGCNDWECWAKVVRFERTVVTGKCGIECKVVLRVEGLCCSREAGLPRLTMKVGSGAAQTTVRSRSLKDFIVTTRDTALIKEIIDQLEASASKS